MNHMGNKWQQGIETEILMAISIILVVSNIFRLYGNAVILADAG